MRYALATDLVDDPARIALFEKAHQALWPEVREHLRTEGVLALEIYRLGTRLFMLMEVDPAVYSAEAMAAAALANPAMVRWNALLEDCLLPVPGAAPNEKWAPLQRIFQLVRLPLFLMSVTSHSLSEELRGSFSPPLAMRNSTPEPGLTT